MASRRSRFGSVATIAFSFLLLHAWAHAQSSRWANPDEPTAKALIALEHQWTDSGCTHNGIEKSLLAEDFYGVAPNGTQYSKKDAVERAENSKITERECQTFEVKVHFFGDSMAILYGSESAVHPGAHEPGADGQDHTVRLTWTDTWLKRHGKWQIVAAEDLPTDVN